MTAEITNLYLLYYAAVTIFCICMRQSIFLIITALFINILHFLKILYFNNMLYIKNILLSIVIIELLKNLFVYFLKAKL